MIEVNQLRKEFKKTVKDPGLMGSMKSLVNRKYEIVEAVKDVSFHVDEGEILGFIGPNGAGKSTVIKMLTGILTPTSGSIEIDGQIPYKNRKNYVKDIGVVFGQRTQLWWDLPLTETYYVLKQIYQIEDKAYEKKMAFLNEVLDLGTFIKSPVRTLSLGQRMRADIAASLLHSPKVLFLDEPTIGLDVMVKDNIRKAITEINAEEKTTIILTTHDLSDIETLCNRIVMINKGEIVYDGDLLTMKHKFGQIREVNISLNNEKDFEKFDFYEKFKVSKNDMEINRVKENVAIKFDAGKVTVSDLLNYVLSTTPIKDIAVKDVDIEDVIIRVYKKDSDEEDA